MFISLRIRTAIRGCRAIAGAAALVATLTGAATGEPAHPNGCTVPERSAALGAEQAEVEDRLSEHLILRDEADLAALAADRETGKAYTLVDHLFASAGGAGIGIVDTLGTPVTAGMPDVLLYAPRPGTKEEEAIDPLGPDWPYRLVGWAYTPFSYDFEGRPKALDGRDARCITAADWFVHERSIHPADTWQNVAAPPKEEAFHGANDNQQVPIPPDECVPSPCPPGLQHPRVWDIHFWRDGAGDGVASVSILSPEEIPGWDPGVGVAFFYPAQQPK